MENSTYLAGYFDGKSSINIMEDHNGFYLTVHLSIPKTVKIKNLEMIFTEEDITKSKSKGKNTVYDMRNVKCQKYIDFMKKHSIYFSKHIKIAEQILELYNKQNKFNEREELHKQFHNIDMDKIENSEKITDEYIAGFFDAHGTILERKTKGTVELKISMKNASGILNLIHKTTNIGRINYNNDEWRFGKREFQTFYEKLNKHIVVKKERLEEINEKYFKNE